MKKPRKNAATRRRDAAPVGYQRWTAFVRVDLLERFKSIAEKEGKTYLQALEEAVENWTDYAPDENNGES